MDITNPKDVDWNRLHRLAHQKKGGKEKKEQDWNERADSFAKRTASSVYIERFIELFSPEPQWSVLDVGSGPGTLALPLAPRVKKVTCIDFAEKMLSILERRAKDRGLNNIHTCKASWEDDWNQLGIVPHDAVFASRSLGVSDLQGALEKLNTFALQKVVVTDKVGHGPFDPDAFDALGRKLKSGPDYIYTVNLLYQLGYHAAVDFIRMDEPMVYESMQDALAGYGWMFPGLTETEKIALKKYIQSITTESRNGKITLRRKQAPTWAFISWTPSQRRLD